MNLNRTTPPGFKEINEIKFIQPECRTLDNSASYCEYNIGEQELLKIEFVFRAGSKYQEKPLVAALTNGMLREGTKSLSSYQIANKIDFYGAFLETDLNSDFASVSLYCLNKHIGNVLPIVVDILTNPSFPESELSKKLSIKKQNFIVSQQQVETLASKAYSNTIFSGTQYNNLTTVESFDTVTREDCVAFFQSHYHLNKMDVFVAGKVDSSVFDRINDSFGTLGSSNQNEPFQFENGDYSPSNVFVEKEGAIQSSFRIGKPIISFDHPDFNKLKVVNTILGGYFGSRLMTNIREEKGYTYGIGSTIMTKENRSSFIIYTEVGTDVSQLALDEVRKEIKLLQHEKVNKQELTKVTNYMLGSLLQSIDGVFSLMERYKTIYYHNLPKNYYSILLEDIKSTNPEEIINLANTYLNELSIITAGSKNVN